MNENQRVSVKRKENGSSSKQEEEDVDEHYKILTEKNGDSVAYR